MIITSTAEAMSLKKNPQLTSEDVMEMKSRFWYFGKQRQVDTNVSIKHIASIFRVEVGTYLQVDTARYNPEGKYTHLITCL